jgi:hypothetical protein
MRLQKRFTRRRKRVMVLNVCNLSSVVEIYQEAS